MVSWLYFLMVSLYTCWLVVAFNDYFGGSFSCGCFSLWFRVLVGSDIYKVNAVIRIVSVFYLHLLILFGLDLVFELNVPNTPY